MVIVGYSVWMAGVEKCVFFTTVMIVLFFFLIAFVLSCRSLQDGIKGLISLGWEEIFRIYFTATGCYYLFSASMSLFSVWFDLCVDIYH